MCNSLLQSSAKKFFFAIMLSGAVCSCSDKENKKTSIITRDSLSEEQMRDPENALAGLALYEGLEITTVATEPFLKNPTNIDVDDRGRVWVTEAINYRPDINGNPTNALGDRIVILEDLNGDGIADTSKVFYQGPDLESPLGICVLGNRVIVSQSPYVWSFYDDNNDDKADRKEIMFQGIGGVQHDHGVHSFTFGPDGKLYFNIGNEGRTLKDKNGKVVLDQDGDEIGPAKYKDGMVMRCEPDGSNVEVLAHNFRNPFEVAVDSYGNLWQSDNDDDGNRGTRINFILDYGNYGFKDEITNASWPENRTNIEDSIPLRHWHLNDPGVVPNLLQTYAGSPSGILFYEGSMLPSAFHNKMIHAEPGNNVVRTYNVAKSGAGYGATIQSLVTGESDRWFRPSDVCVAPDGSLIIADWYDPGVGGHQAGDQTRGRIYRVATNRNYKIPKHDYQSVTGAITALQSPNLAVRYKAWTALNSIGPEAVKELETLWNSNSSSTMRARAFWLLIKKNGSDHQKYIQQAIEQQDVALQIMGIKAARQMNADIIGVVKQLSKHPDIHIRRECAIALHHLKDARAAEVWTELASMHDGKDRWYLEALGIGADGQWDQFFPQYIAGIDGALNSEAARDIIWRSRGSTSLKYLSQLATNTQMDIKTRLRYFRAFDFNSSKEKSQYLLNMLSIPDLRDDSTITKLVLWHLEPSAVTRSPVARNALKNLLTSSQGTMEYLELVRKYDLKTENRRLVEMAVASADKNEGRQAVRLLLKAGGSGLVWDEIKGKDTSRGNAMIRSLSRAGTTESVGIIQKILLTDNFRSTQRKLAAAVIGRSGEGEDLALELLRNKRVPSILIPDVVASVQSSWKEAVREEAKKYLSNSLTSKAKEIPTIGGIETLEGSEANGKKVYIEFCGVCHQINQEGFDFGPPLHEIGGKYGKDGLLESIVYPSKGISFGYEGWSLKMMDGSTLTGIIGSKSESEVTLKLPGGTQQKIRRGDIISMSQLKESMMPEGLHEGMSMQEMADLIEYMNGLKKR